LHHLRGTKPATCKSPTAEGMCTPLASSGPAEGEKTVPPPPRGVPWAKPLLRSLEAFPLRWGRNCTDRQYPAGPVKSVRGAPGISPRERGPRWRRCCGRCRTPPTGSSGCSASWSTAWSAGRLTSARGARGEGALRGDLGLRKTRFCPRGQNDGQTRGTALGVTQTSH